MSSKKSDNLKIDPNKIEFIESFETGLTDHPALAILQDEDKIVIGGKSGAGYKLQIYDFQTHALEYEINAHEKRIIKILPVPSGILSISFDGTLKVFNYTMKLIDGHSVGFMPFDVCEAVSGKNYIVVGQSNTVKMLNFAEKTFTDWTTISEVDQNEGFSAVTVISNKSWVVLGLALSHRIYIVELATKTVAHKLEGDKKLNGISQLHWLPTPVSLVASNETDIVVWDLRAGALSQSTKYAVSGKKVKKLYAFPAVDLFIASFLESQLFALRISDGKQLNNISAKMDEAFDIVVHESSKSILVSDSSRGIISIIGPASAGGSGGQKKKVKKSACKCLIF